MGLILCLETATEVCSVALALNGNIVKIKESSSPNEHSSLLTVFIEEIIASGGYALSNLDAVAVSMGPGSYTGIRIGVATAKGLCYSLEKPLIAISTLQSMALGMKNHASAGRETQTGLSEPPPIGFFCPLIDARRMEVYTAVYDTKMNPVKEAAAEIIQDTSFDDFLIHRRMVFAGSGAEKCKPLLEHRKNAFFIDNFTASAKFMAALAEDKWNRDQFENIAYFEPFYLKDFIAGKPRVKGLV